MFGIMLYDILFFGIPASMFLFFGISLYRYRRAKKENREHPGTYSPEEMKKRKLMLIVSSVIVGVLLAVIIGFIVLMYMAVAFM